ncbi:hypothetical protein EVG20_g6467 [Dentipellis fragilis]|uniref:HNH nuclease domain-containing protein n=1 Tax=Dentipellis fragilis TaxID=205917 RepID=A0A4Y9YKJ1_9AGAM|nr:hypothetical protein EVG20_g6467 [Dentipellis fragilis]
MPATILVYTQFPTTVSRRIPNDWKWTRTLAFPLDDLAKLKLSPTPFKWIRYATGVVVGAQGDLSHQRDSVALVNYDDPLPGESLELYYHVSDEKKLHMFPLDPLLANSRTATPSAKSTRQANFGGEVMQRDGGRKGSSYIEAFTRGRHRGPDDENDIIDDIDSVRNGLFLDKALHAELGSDFAILVTPNFAMDTSDVDVQPGTHGHGQRYTAHFFDLPFVAASNLPGRAIRTPDEMSEWPPTMLFDAVYASAVLHHFGVVPPRTLDPWNDIFYSGERTTTEQVDEQRRREQEAKEDEQTEQSRLERNERYMQRRTGGSAVDGIDPLMLPYMLIPRDRMAKYAEERQEALAEEEREVLEAKVSSWRDKKNEEEKKEWEEIHIFLFLEPLSLRGSLRALLVLLPYPCWPSCSSILSSSWSSTLALRRWPCERRQGRLKSRARTSSECDEELWMLRDGGGGEGRPLLPRVTVVAACDKGQSRLARDGFPLYL